MIFAQSYLSFAGDGSVKRPSSIICAINTLKEILVNNKAPAAKPCESPLTIGAESFAYIEVKDRSFLIDVQKNKAIVYHWPTGHPELFTPIRSKVDIGFDQEITFKMNASDALAKSAGTLEISVHPSGEIESFTVSGDYRSTRLPVSNSSSVYSTRGVLLDEALHKITLPKQRKKPFPTGAATQFIMGPGVSPSTIFVNFQNSAKKWRDFFNSTVRPDLREYLKPVATAEQLAVKRSHYSSAEMHRGITLTHLLKTQDVQNLFFKPDPLLSPHSLSETPRSEIVSASTHLVTRFSEEFSRNKPEFLEVVRGHSAAASDFSPFVSFSNDRNYAAGFMHSINSSYSLEAVRSVLLITVRQPRTGIVDRFKLAEQSAQAGMPLRIITGEDEILHFGTIDPDSVDEILMVNEKYSKSGYSDVYDQPEGVDSIFHFKRDDSHPAEISIERLTPQDLDPELRRRLLMHDI
jgi:hypothetical protein